MRDALAPAAVWGWFDGAGGIPGGDACIIAGLEPVLLWEWGRDGFVGDACNW